MCAVVCIEILLNTMPNKTTVFEFNIVSRDEYRFKTCELKNWFSRRGAEYFNCWYYGVGPGWRITVYVRDSQLALLFALAYSGQCQ